MQLAERRKEARCMQLLLYNNNDWRNYDNDSNDDAV